MARQIRKPPEGAKMPESADMKAWKEEFDEMGMEEHLKKLKELGLDEEELEEFKALEAKEVSLEEDLVGPTGGETEGAPLEAESQESPKIKKADNQKKPKKK